MTAYRFRKHQALSLRLWHWLNAAVILGLLGTVLLRKTLLSWRGNAALIEEKLKAAGSAITPELAKDIAVGIRNPLWDWHIYLGFTLGALLLGRILIALFIEKRLPLAHALKSLRGVPALPASQRPAAWHYGLVKLGYAGFYAATLFMVLSGLLLTFKARLALDPGLVDTAKELHELALGAFVLFGGAHLAGVVLAEQRGEAGLVSDMIHGGPKS